MLHRTGAKGGTSVPQVFRWEKSPDSDPGPVLLGPLGRFTYTGVEVMYVAGQKFAYRLEVGGAVQSFQTPLQQVEHHLDFVLSHLGPCKIFRRIDTDL